MGRTLRKYPVFCAFALLAIAAKAAFGDSAPAGREEEPTYVENREPLEHVWLDPDWAALVDSAANVIADSANCLEPLMKKLLALRSGADSVVSILHIGDSHVQAGYWTSRMRELFQSDFGDAGRGLIVPYKLAGGNEPRNYAVKTGYAFSANKATANRSGEPLGFTGVEVTFSSPWAEFEVWSKKGFNSITLFHHSGAPMLNPPDSLLPDSYCDIDNTPTSTRIVLRETVDTVRLQGFTCEQYDTPSYYGFSLENGDPGVLYHAVGSNGAAFEHFTANTTVADGGAGALHPDLVIISLGTNNCYGGNYRSGAVREVITGFVSRVRAGYPNSALLLTTPRESCRRSGRKYLPNPNIADVAGIIREVAAENGVACWDLYSAAGGKGICEDWFRKGLSGRDRIHLTENGYAFQGDMFYEAFVKYYNDWLSPAECDTQPAAGDV